MRLIGWGWRGLWGLFILEFGEVQFFVKGLNIFLLVELIGALLFVSVISVKIKSIMVPQEEPTP